MRRLSERNKVPVYYATYDGVVDTTEDGLYTGENLPQYSAPTMARMVVGLNSGSAMLEQFGIYDPFSVKITTDDESCPISTSSILWLNLGELAEYDPETTYAEGDTVIKDGKIEKLNAAEEWEEVPHTHIVRQVAKSFGYISYLAKEVEVTSGGE